jgi:hypothetical protein
MIIRSESLWSDHHVSEINHGGDRQASGQVEHRRLPFESDPVAGGDHREEETEQTKTQSERFKRHHDRQPLQAGFNHGKHGKHGKKTQ